MKEVIFLVSAPRSGSSLLQQILNSDPRIKSLPEPWIMLPIVNIFKHDKEARAAYNADYARINMNDFFERVPEAAKIFQGQIKNAASSTYRSLLSDGENYFLDKTPRYYHIISYLLDWFPNAKVILLARNPAAIFCSIMDYNFNGKTDWLAKQDRIHDILTAPEQLATYKSNDRCFYLRYEDLVNDSDQVVKRLYQYLNLSPLSDKELGEYKLDDVFTNTTSIDTKSVQKHQRPVKDYLDRWMGSINTHPKKRLLLEYLEYLNDQTLKELGYSKKELQEKAKAIRVSWSPWSVSFRLASANYGKGWSWKERLLMASLRKIKK